MLGSNGRSHSSFCHETRKPYSFPICPAVKFCLVKLGKHPFFLALISVAGGGVTIRHDGTLRTRRWRCVPAIDVENQRKKTGQWHWKNLSFNRKSFDSNGGFSTVDGSFSGWRIHLPRILWDDLFHQKVAWFFRLELCEIDSDIPVDFLTCQKSHTHLKQPPSFFVGFPKVYWK